MWQFETHFSEIIVRAPAVKSFQFPVPAEQAPFEPGQFMFLTIRVNGAEALHHFTISSSPTDPYLEFTKRITEHDYSQALDAARPGDWARIQGAAGSFTLPKEKRPLALLTGGIGITPARSMLRHLFAKNEERDIVLLFGNLRYEDIVFKAELDEIASAMPGVRVEYVLGQPPPDWSGKSGMIDKSLIMETIKDYQQRLFYISGPPRMVMSLQTQLAALKIPLERIIRDSFTGYD